MDDVLFSFFNLTPEIRSTANVSFLLEVSDAKRLHDLEVENARLKKLLAVSILDNASVRSISRGGADNIH